MEYATLGNYRMLITGEGITDTSADTTQVFIGGKQQEVVLVGPYDGVEVLITDIDSGLTPQSLEVYFGVGLPNGLPDFAEGVIFEPKLRALAAHEGSAGGAVFHADVVGAGALDELTLVDQDGNDICETAEVVSYSVLECHTVAQELALTDLSVKDSSGTIYPCASPDPADCQYQTYAAEAAIQYASVAISGVSDLVFTGTNFDCLACDSCEVSFVGVAADSCAIVSGTQVTATFDTGLPITAEESVPELTLLDTSAVRTVRQSALAPETGVANPLVVTGETAGLTCSFAGGCEYRVTAAGLTTSIKAGLAEIQVCGKTCTLSEGASSATEAACELPYVQSTASLDEFVQEDDATVATGFLFGSSWAIAPAFDGAPLPGISGTGAGCFAGVGFRGGSKGALAELRFFMDYFPDPARLVGNLIF